MVYAHSAGEETKPLEAYWGYWCDSHALAEKNHQFRGLVPRFSVGMEEVEGIEMWKPHACAKVVGDRSQEAY